MPIGKRISQEGLNIKELSLNEKQQPFLFNPKRDFSQSQKQGLFRDLESYRAGSSRYYVALMSANLKILYPNEAPKIETEEFTKIENELQTDKKDEEWGDFLPLALAIKILQPSKKFVFSQEEAESIEVFLTDPNMEPYYQLLHLAEIKIIGLPMDKYLTPEFWGVLEATMAEMKEKAPIEKLFRFAASMRIVKPNFDPELTPKHFQAIKGVLKAGTELTDLFPVSENAVNAVIASASTVKVTNNGLELGNLTEMQTDNKTGPPETKHF